MADINYFPPIPEEYAEEVLIAGIMSSPMKQYENLLKSLKDIDVRDRWYRTLLHVGVFFGKLDWVEGLLEEGADPCLRDRGKLTALEIAQEMTIKYPEDGDRRDILRRITLIERRDKAIKRRRALHVGDLNAVPLNDFTREMAKLSALKESIDCLKTESSSTRRQIAEEVHKLTRDISDRDVLLECLEGAVTSSVEELRALKECVGESMDRISVRVSSLSTEETKWECIEGMMGKTTIMNEDEGKVSHVKGIYEKVFDLSAVTSCALIFLQRQSDVRVVVDCDSYSIGNMKAMFTDHDGVECSGIQCMSFADFSQKTVYLGAKVTSLRLLNDEWFHVEKLALTWFSVALAKMCNYLAFGNDGKPYDRDDRFLKGKFKSAIEEAKEERRGRLDYYIRLLLGMKTQLGREIEFASVVPMIIVQYGSTEGTSILRHQIPSLLSFYEEHVMARLRETRRRNDCR